MKFLGKIDEAKDIATKEYVDDQASGSLDADSLDAFIPLSRDFSDDFNNDYAR